MQESQLKDRHCQWHYDVNNLPEKIKASISTVSFRHNFEPKARIQLVKQDKLKNVWNLLFGQILSDTAGK